MRPETEAEREQVLQDLIAERWPKQNPTCPTCHSPFGKPSMWCSDFYCGIQWRAEHRRRARMRASSTHLGDQPAIHGGEW